MRKFRLGPAVLLVLIILLDLYPGHRSAAQEPHEKIPLLRIEGLKSSYKEGEAIEFSVVKLVPNSIGVACAAEMFWDGRFSECNWDISVNALKVAFRKTKMLGSTPMIMRWDAPHLMAAKRPEAGRIYRLRIDVLQPKGDPVYSSQFQIEK